MAKKTDPNARLPLSHFWMPPSDIIDGGVGKPWACIATTFMFDAEFYESELLPRFLGLRFDQTENETTFLVEREEALALAHASVLVDYDKFSSNQTTLRWDQLQIQIPGGIQHAKITLLAWEKLIRVIVSSANLTRPGYRKNREIFAALDFWNGSESTPLSLLDETNQLLTAMLTWSRSAQQATERTETTIANIKRRIRRWSEAPREFSPRERPRATFAATHPRSEGLKSRSSLDELIDEWGNRRATSVVVVTPFAAPNPDSDIGDTVVNQLSSIAKTRECDGWLIVPELPKTPEDNKTRLPFPQVFGDSWKQQFARYGGAHVLPMPLCLEDVEDRNRTFHSKSVLIENDKDNVAMMMIGSSNFTPRGMGVGVSNFEANLIFEDVGDEKRDGLRLIDRLGMDRAWDEGISVDEAIWQTPEEPPEDEPSGRPVLPPFFSWAMYSQLTGALTLGVDRNKEQPTEWSVRLPGTEDEAFSLFTQDSNGEKDDPDNQLICTLPDSMRSAHIVAIVVRWKNKDGKIHSAKTAVAVESEEHLLPPEEFRKLSADAIIECLISGKTPSQWIEGRTNGKSSGQDKAALESLRAVDTSSFLLYRIRRFARALTGMSHRITKTIPLPDAVQYRLMKDPFGPISLARTICNIDTDVTGGWWESLENSHRAFLVAEIQLMVIHIEKHLVRQTKGKDRRQIKDLFSNSVAQLQQLLDEVTGSESLPENLQKYVNQIQQLAPSVAASAKEAKK